MIGYEWHDLVGNVGVLFVLVTYFGVQIERIPVTGYLYSSLNALGSLLIIISLLVDFNLSAFVVEFSWLLLSLIGIARRFYLIKQSPVAH